MKSTCNDPECPFCHGGELPPAKKKDSPTDPVPQKIKGIEVLKSHLYDVGTVVETIVAIPPSWSLEDIKAKVTVPSWLGSWGIFGRPCPMVPQHGFVDSKLVTNVDDVIEMVKATRAADPKGWVILMPKIQAEWNAIWTPGLFTIGEGHDGATNGVNTIKFPLVTQEGSVSIPKTLSGLKKGDAPYIEMVYGTKEEGGYRQVWLTQLRGGPPVPKGCTDNFIPEEMVVDKIVQVDPNTSLLEWADQVKKFAPNTVVYHPGGSPADHWFVHCRLSKIPVVTTYCPKKGETLAPTPAGPVVDPEKVLAGVVAGGTYPMNLDETGYMTNLILACLHNSGAMGGQSSFWLGVMAGLLVRLGSIALRGEARHHNGSHKQPRQTVYAKHLNHSLSYHRAGLERLAHLFRYGNWSAGAIGGQRWAECAYGLDPIFKAIRQLALTKSPEAVNQLVGAVNVAVNQAHNNGWWLNKFSDVQMATKIAMGELNSLIGCLRAIRKMDQYYQKLDQGSVQNMASRWALWPEINIKGLQPQNLFVEYVPGMGIQVKIRRRMFSKNNNAAFLVGTNEITKLVAQTLAGVHVRKTPNGLSQIVGSLPQLDSLVLWEDQPLVVKNKKLF